MKPLQNVDTQINFHVETPYDLRIRDHGYEKVNIPSHNSYHAYDTKETHSMVNPEVLISNNEMSSHLM